MLFASLLTNRQVWLITSKNGAKTIQRCTLSCEYTCTERGTIKDSLTSKLIQDISVVSYPGFPAPAFFAAVGKKMESGSTPTATIKTGAGKPGYEANMSALLKALPRAKKTIYSLLLFLLSLVTFFHPCQGQRCCRHDDRSLG